MAHWVLNRVQETTISTGTGALTLAGAASKMLGFVASGVANGDTFLGLIEHATAAEWELAVCTYNSAGTTVTRAATPLKSSTGSAVSFSAGTKTISIVEMSAPRVHPFRLIVAGASTTMTAADFEVCIDTAAIAAAHAVTLPPNPVPGQTVLVSDGTGSCATYNITVSPAAGLINGAANQVMVANYQKVLFRYSGTKWNII